MIWHRTSQVGPFGFGRIVTQVHCDPAHQCNFADVMPAGTADIAIIPPDVENAFRMGLERVREHPDHIGRLRILVIGRSNSGKTTLLQRICNATELPEVFNSKGERVRYLLLPCQMMWLMSGVKLDPGIVQGSLEASK